VLATGGGNGPSLGYAGGLTDAATGLVRFGARDYDPTVGRWTTKDPIGFAGGDGGLYVYAGLDPIDATDPSGLAKRSRLPGDGVLKRFGLCRRGKPLSTPQGSGDDNAYTWDDFFDTSVQGLAAFADGFIPFWDPFAAHGAYDPHDPTYGPSKEIGVLTRDAEVAIALARPKVWNLRDGSKAATLVDWGGFFRLEGHAIGRGAANAFRWHVDALWGAIRHWPWGL
jgi:RHS repeat-associated protein